MFQPVIQTIFVFTLLCLKENETATTQQSSDPVCSHFGNVIYLKIRLFWICFCNEEVGFLLYLW